MKKENASAATNLNENIWVMKGQGKKTRHAALLSSVPINSMRNVAWLPWVRFLGRIPWNSHVVKRKSIGCQSMFIDKSHRNGKARTHLYMKGRNHFFISM